MDAQEQMMKVFKMLEDGWTGALLSAGISSGIFGLIHEYGSVSLKEISEELGYDQLKLDMWFYFGESQGWVKKDKDKFQLTELGMNFSPAVPNPDMKGLLQLSQYYFSAAAQASETFKPQKSLDKLSDGKISREYQPRVSDNFSLALKDLFLKHNFKEGETLLDVGSGNGSFLRNLSRQMEGIQLNGVDTNLFAIEKGKALNKENGLEENINLLVGDITEDLDDFPDGSYDWVTSINVMHFLDIGKRLPVIEHMIRIARKGVFVTQVMIETTPLSRAANPLMGLLWNDYTGFFYKNELENLNKYLENKYKNHRFTIEAIMKGNSHILMIEPK